MSNQHAFRVLLFERTELQFKAGNYAISNFYSYVISGDDSHSLFILLNSECLSKSFPLGLSKV